MVTRNVCPLPNSPSYHTDIVLCEDTTLYSEPVNAFTYSITNDKEYFYAPYLEKCIEQTLEQEVANVWCKKIINVLQTYEEMYSNEMLVTIPKLCFYIRNMPFLEIINTKHSHQHKFHNIKNMIYYFPVPRSSHKPRYIKVISPKN